MWFTGRIRVTDAVYAERDMARVIEVMKRIG
jgi:hypothetical protein